MVVAVVAPGQGAQKPGFLTPWLELPGAQARLAWWSGFAGVDLVRLGTTADADEIKDTAKTQPLMVAAALLAAEHIGLDEVSVVAGHSVGELAAAAMAGVLSPENAVTLAAHRGKHMAAACSHADTGMAAVLGGDATEVAQAIADAGLDIANYNSAGQVVAAGPKENIAKLSENPPTKARVIPLQVAGAFHTGHMATAQTALEELAAGIATRNPEKIMISNADGTAVESGEATLRRLVAQVTKPVRWDLCQSCLKDLGVTAIIELPPAGTLVGLAKRELPDIERLAVNTPEDLAAARALIAQHGSAPTGEPSVRFNLAVAATAGTFEPADIEVGAFVKPQTSLGIVKTRQGETPVTARGAGILTEWLAHAGDPVAAGAPLARLQSDPEFAGPNAKVMGS